MRTYLMLLSLLCLTGCQATFFAAVNATQSSSGVVAHRDIPFAPERGLSLDVYSPVHAEHAPVVVFFYGGDWRFGKRAWYRWLGEALARQGVVAILPDYRHWPAVRMDGFVSDGAEAVRWARDHAAAYGGDASHLFVMGHSSGGHIAAMLATDKQWLARVGMTPRDLSGLIGVAGAFDFLPLGSPRYVDMFGSTPDEQARSQPINFVDGDEPPALLLQGAADTVVYPAEAISLDKHYRQQSEPVELKIYPGVGHRKIVLTLGVLRHSAPTLDDTMAFIRQYSQR